MGSSQALEEVHIGLYTKANSAATTYVNKAGTRLVYG